MVMDSQLIQRNFIKQPTIITDSLQWQTNPNTSQHTSKQKTKKHNQKYNKTNKQKDNRK